ncbi:Gfo/Idh/MocA family oxidoreductase [Pseudoclavibacter terrae]|uniref:Gfo/Idh/MocA family protein n=1 Tax=Pseudoclavibacter terrae TaxID=1530195 RepID=UPI00232DED36|nr:Gfo/Idh/MocA family oxidoreductase [Pseudoclavibacter terrae]
MTTSPVDATAERGVGEPRRQLSFGLIGSGRIGQVHARSIALSGDATLAWVADPNLPGAVALSEMYGARATASTAELIDCGDIDAVLVASPTPTHIDLIESCLDAGLPVLCEKPIDLDISRVDALMSKVSLSKIPVALGFNQRFDPSFAEVRSRLLAGEVGELEHLTLISRDPGPPPSAYIGVSGGIFRDMTIHDFDLARFFVGEIAEVSAVGAQMFDAGAREHGDFDSAVVTLRAVSGALVTIINSRHSAVGYEQRLEAFGADGILQVGNAPTSLVTSSTSSGVETRPPYVDLFLERFADAYTAELAAFIQLVRGEPSGSPTYTDGREALLLANAAQLSAETGALVRLER